MCSTFYEKIINSDANVVLNNIFMGVALLRSFATRYIFALSILRGNRTALNGANALWEREKMTATECGDILMARSDEPEIIKWIDSHAVHLMSTKHIFVED